MSVPSDISSGAASVGVNDSGAIESVEGSSPAPGWRSGQPAQRVVPLLKSSTTVDQTAFLKDGADSVTSFSALNFSAPVLHTNSAPGFSLPSQKAVTAVEPLGDLPSLPAARALLKRPAPRPGSRTSAAMSQTLGRGRKEGDLHPATPPRSNFSRRSRSKSLPGLPSWLLQRRNHRNSKQFGALIPDLYTSLQPDLLDLRQTGLPPRAAILSRNSSVIDIDDDSDSDTDSSSSEESDTELDSPNAPSHSPPMRRMPPNSTLTSSTGSLSLESPSSQASSPGGQQTSSDSRSSGSKDKKPKDKLTSTKDAKDKTKDKSAKKDKDAKSTDKVSKHKKIKSDSSEEAVTSKPSTPTPISTATSAPLAKSGQNRTGRRRQFVTAFDWLKSYAAGQVQLDEEDTTSSEEPVEPARSIERNFPFSNDGTGSGDDEEYDEEELHLISDTDDVSASVDHDILDSSSGGFFSSNAAGRRGVLKQHSSGVSSSPSNSLATNTSSGSRATRLETSDQDSSGSGSTGNAHTSSAHRGSSPSTMIKSGSGITIKDSGDFSRDTPSDSPAGSPALSKSSKRKTDRPPKRKDQDGETATKDASKEAADDDVFSPSSASAKPSQKSSRRTSERRSHRPEATEGDKSPPSRRAVSPGQDRHRRAISPLAGVGDSTLGGQSSTKNASGKPTKPKFNRASTVFEDRSPTHTRSSSSSGAASTKFSRSPKEGMSPARSTARPVLTPTTSSHTLNPPVNAQNSWKKSPDIVKLRKVSVRMQNTLGSDATPSKDADQHLVKANALATPTSDQKGGAGSDSAHCPSPAAAASKTLLANLNADLEEFEEDGVRFVVPKHPPNSPRIIYAISLDKLLELIFEDWNKERIMREDFLSVLPFLGKPVEIIEAMSNYWTRRLAVFQADAAARSGSFTGKKNLKNENKESKVKEVTTPDPESAFSDPLRASVTSTTGLDEHTLQRRIVAFLTEWVKTNFTYFTEIPVLEAVCRFLDRLDHRNSGPPSSPTSPAPQGAVSKTSKDGIGPLPVSPSGSPAPGASASNASPSSSKMPSLKLGALKIQASAESLLSGRSVTSPTGAAADIPEAPKWQERELLVRIIQYKLAGVDPRDLPGLVVRMKHPRSGVKVTVLNTSRGQVHMFQACDAMKWLRKLTEENVEVPQASLFRRLLGKTQPENGAPVSARGSGSAAAGSGSGASSPSGRVPLQREPSLAGVFEIDSTEVLSQLLRERLIAQVSSRSGKLRDSSSLEIGELQIKKKKSYAFTITEHVESNARLMNLQPLTRTPSTSSNNGNETQTFFLQTQPDTFARQLAIMELNLFQRIEPHELHMWVKSSEKAKRAKAAPNMLRLTNNFNRMTAWVATEIVTTANPKQRISTLKRFILVAQYCLKYKNYQGLLEVMLGMQDTAVARLSAWRALPEKYTHMFQRLSEITNPGGNWKNFRLLIETEQSACVPYIGLLTSDLTFVQDATSSELNDKRLNWKKAQRIAATFAALKRMQRRAYTFAPDFGIIKYITDELVTIEEDKERLIRSRLLEPTRARSGSIV